MATTELQAIQAQAMAQDIALCGLLATIARVQPAFARAVAEDIRAKADQLQNSSTSLAAEANRKAVAYAEIVERITRGENPGSQNAELNAITGRSN